MGPTNTQYARLTDVDGGNDLGVGIFIGVPRYSSSRARGYKEGARGRCALLQECIPLHQRVWALRPGLRQCNTLAALALSISPERLFSSARSLSSGIQVHRKVVE